jgi:hypothetical protein
MELEDFEKAKEIKEELSVMLRLNGFCNNSRTQITLGKFNSLNEWETIKLPNLVEARIICHIRTITNTRIKELEQQFKEL